MKWVISLCLFLIGLSGLHAQEEFGLPVVVMGMAIHPSGEYVALSIGMEVCHPSVDHKITLKSYPDLETLSFIDLDADCLATGLEWSTDGRYLLITTDGTAYVWDNKQQKLISTSHPYSMGQRFGDKFSPDGTVIANTSDLSGIHFWNPQTGETVRELFTGDVLFAISWSPDGAFFVTSLYQHPEDICHVVEAKTLTTIAQFPCYSGIPSWSPNGKYIFNANQSSFYVWETESYTLLNQWDNPVGFEDFEWMPDGKHIAMVLSNQKLTLWDVETGIKTSEVALETPVSRIRVSPIDGSIIYIPVEETRDEAGPDLQVIRASSFSFVMPTPTPTK